MKKLWKHVIGVSLCFMLLLMAGNIVQAEEVTILRKDDGTVVKTNVIFEDENTFYIEVEYENDASNMWCYKMLDGVVYSWLDNPDDIDYANVIAICPAQEQKTITIQGCIKAFNEEFSVCSVSLEKASQNVEKLIIQGCGESINIHDLTGLSGLKTITMAGDCSRVWIDNGCLAGCKNLESITYENQKPEYVVENGAVYRFRENTKELVSVLDDSLTQYTIQGDVTSVWGPFSTNKKIKELTINGNLEYFDAGELVKLEEIKISENVERIDRIYLDGAKKIQNLDFSGVSAKVFSAKGAKNLRTVSLPANCILQEEAFCGCKNLRTVTFNDTKAVQRIKRNAFKNTRSGIKFYVKNKKVAKSLKKELKKSGVKNGKIYVKRKLIYSSVK